MEVMQTSLHANSTQALPLFRLTNKGAQAAYLLFPMTVYHQEEGKGSVV